MRFDDAGSRTVLQDRKLSRVCEKLGFLRCLISDRALRSERLEIVATELAETIGVDLPQLPLVLSAAQWLEEQALADGCFGLALRTSASFRTSAVC